MDSGQVLNIVWVLSYRYFRVQVMIDLLWSDPTEHDNVEGGHDSPRGETLIKPAASQT